MKIYIAGLVSLIILHTLGCNASTQASKNAGSPAPQRTSEKSSGKELKDDGDKQKYYRTFGTVSWEVDQKGTLVEAKIETTKVSSDQRPLDIPTFHLEITNLTTSKAIYTQDLNEFPLSMYTRNVNGDSYDELILVLSAGASANQLEILSVSATQVRELLAVQYRMDATLVGLSEGLVDVLVTPGFDRPFRTTRYVLKGKRYVPVGTVPYDKLVNVIKSQFNAR